ncbi:hypothetical protein H4I95_00278 [Botrytis cinerea]
MLRLGISFPDDITSDPDFNSDIDSEDLDSSLTSISSSSSSSSTSQSQSESESQSITHIKSDDESTDSDLGTESSDSDGASSPPMSMLMNALNSGPLADEDADADTDEDEDENADPDSALDSGSEGEGDVDTGTNVNPEPTTVVLSLGTAVASAVPFDVMNKGGVSSLGAGESSTLVSSLEGLETSSATAGSNANELTSSALPSQSISEGGLMPARQLLLLMELLPVVLCGLGENRVWKDGWQGAVCFWVCLLWFGLCCKNEGVFEIIVCGKRGRIIHRA